LTIWTVMMPQCLLVSRVQSAHHQRMLPAAVWWWIYMCQVVSFDAYLYFTYYYSLLSDVAPLSVRTVLTSLNYKTYSCVMYSSLVLHLLHDDPYSFDAVQIVY